MVVSKRVAWFFVAFGVWSWIIWPTFLKNIWADDRSWADGATSFFLVHLVLVVVSLVLGTIIAALGVRALLRRRRHTAQVLRQAADGTRVTVMVDGKPVAEIEPVYSARPHYLTRAGLLTLLDRQADAGLSADLKDLAGDTEADLDPR